MTPQEAIKELKSDKELYESDIVSAGDGTPEGDLILALDMAISALEKQIPKKVKNIYNAGSIKYGTCPCCFHIVNNNTNIKICNNVVCGQAIDWEQSNDTET